MSLFKLIIATTAVGFLGLACGGSTPAQEAASGPTPRDSKILPWEVISVSPPYALKVGAGVGYCVGDPRPTIKRPNIRYEDENVYVRLKITRPRKGSTKSRLCAGKELLITRQIKLRRDLFSVKIYDSGASPPELRWPTK